MIQTNEKIVANLEKIGACSEAVEWVKSNGGNSKQLWATCERGDWMGWYLGKQRKYNKSKNFYLALADIAETSLHLFEDKHPDDKRPRQAIETLRKYTNGRATKEQLKTASYAADAAAGDADAATYDTTYAAYAAAAATYAAAGDASAVYHAAAATTIKQESLRESADIFRKYFPKIGG